MDCSAHFWRVVLVGVSVGYVVSSRGKKAYGTSTMLIGRSLEIGSLEILTMSEATLCSNEEVHRS